MSYNSTKQNSMQFSLKSCDDESYLWTVILFVNKPLSPTIVLYTKVILLW